MTLGQGLAFASTLVTSTIYKWLVTVKLKCSRKKVAKESTNSCTGELGYDGLNGTRKIGPSYAKSVVYI